MRARKIGQWPPDTEDLTQQSDATYVNLGAINQLMATRLLPPQNDPLATAQPSDQPMLFPADATAGEKQVIAAQNQGLRTMTKGEAEILASTQQYQQDKDRYFSLVEGLMSKGMNESNAKMNAQVQLGYMIDDQGNYQKDPTTDPSITGQAGNFSVATHLTPIGDLVAGAEGLINLAQGNFLEGALGTGLALGSVFMPGTMRADMFADDMLRTTAMTSARNQAISPAGADLVDLAMDYGQDNINRYYSYVSPAERVYRPDLSSFNNLPGTDVDPELAGAAFVRALRQEGNISDLNLQEMAAVLDAQGTAMMNAGSLRDTQNQFLQGIVREVENAGSVTGVNSGVTKTKVGNFDVTITEPEVALRNTRGGEATVWEARGKSGQRGFVKAKDLGDGTIGYDFNISFAGSQAGMSAKDLANMNSEVDVLMKNMYQQVPVNGVIVTDSFSTDSYPMMLAGFQRGQYAINGTGKADIKMHTLNQMGERNTLFKRFEPSQELRDAFYMNDKISSKLKSGVNDRLDMWKSGGNYTQQQIEEKRLEFLQNGMDRLLDTAIKDPSMLTYIYGDGVTDIAKRIQAEAIDHINVKINKANVGNFNARVRDLMNDKGLSKEEATKRVKQTWQAIPPAQVSDGTGNYMEGKLLVPTPPQRKLRMEEGGMVFKTVKKKPVAKRGYRLKKK